MSHRLPPPARPKRIGPVGALGVLVALVALVATTLALAPVGPAGAAEPHGIVTVMANNVRQPEAMVAGPDGNLWFVNRGSDSIGRVTPAGGLTFFSDPKLHGPHDITAGPDGNLWFGNDTDQGSDHGSIGRITPAGLVTVFPSSGSLSAITAGPDGRLWFINGNRGIGAITTTGLVTMYTGRIMNSADAPSDIIVGPDGNLWFTNAVDSTIGRITPAGVLLPAFTSPQITFPQTITTGADGNVWFAGGGARTIGRITPTGVITTFSFFTGNGPSDITTGPDGNVWFAASARTGPQRLGRITPLGVITFIETPADATYVAAGPDGNVWFSSPLDHVVGRVTAAGTTAAFGDARVSGPSRITTGPDGNLWYTNQRGSSIGRVTPAGVKASFAGPGVLAPFDITAGPDGNLWFTNFASIGRITPAGDITKFAGPGIVAPVEITAGPDGNLWFTDAGNHAVGRITTAGVVTTFTADQVQKPAGITTNSDGNLWFTDIAAGSVNRITTAGVITTFPDRGEHPQAITDGPGGILYYADAGSSLRRLFPNGDSQIITMDDQNAKIVTDLTVDAHGTLWVNDAVWYAGHVGRISRIETSALTADPGQPLTTAVAFSHLSGGGGVTIGPDGNLWFTEREADAIGFTGTDLTPPSAPNGLTGSAGHGVVTLHWSAPITGVAGLTAYTVTPSIGGVMQPPVVLAPGRTTATITGLTNGTTYTFTVTATNLGGTGPSSAPSPSLTPTGFVDVPIGAPFHDDIDWFAAEGITTGNPGDLFLPNALVTRQAAAAYLYRFRGSPRGVNPVCTPGPDVPFGAPFCAEIRWLVDEGISSGYPDGGFHPAAPVSRQALAALLYRTTQDRAQWPPCNVRPFPDVPVDHPFCHQIEWLAEHDVIQGYPDGGFHPAALVSRQATAAFFHRLDGVLP